MRSRATEKNQGLDEKFGNTYVLIVGDESEQAYKGNVGNDQQRKARVYSS